MIGIPKLIGYWSITMSFFTLMLITSTFAIQIQLVYAGGRSPYESGYDHGCDDAGISDPGERYINQPEKGPSFHTDEFMDGYNDGYDECSSGGGADSSGSNDELAEDEWNDSCRDAGYDDGRNRPFSLGTYDHCGEEEGGDDAYYNGFIEGCMSVEGNTRDVCESATDS